MKIDIDDSVVLCAFKKAIESGEWEPSTGSDPVKIPSRGGFRKIRGPWSEELCRHPEHDPPGMIVLPPGVYEYTCPGCGHTQVIHVPTIFC